jgi:hypothetical protein
METGCHATDLGMYATQSSSAASSGVGVTILDNRINNPADLSIRKGISSAVT